MVSLVMALMAVFPGAAAEVNVQESTVVVLSNTDNECVVKEFQKDNIIISTNNKKTNRLTIERYDSTEQTLLSREVLDLNTLAENYISDNGIALQSGDVYQHTFSNREYDIFYSYASPQWQIRSQDNRKLGYESTVNNMSYLENFRNAVEDINATEFNIIGAVGSTVAVTAIAAYLTGGIGAGSAAAGGSAAIIAEFTSLNTACRNADYYFNRISFRPY